MQALVKSDYFKAMNIACELDEGGPFPMDPIPIFYQDKTPWRKYIYIYMCIFLNFYDIPVIEEFLHEKIIIMFCRFLK